MKKPPKKRTKNTLKGIYRFTLFFFNPSGYFVHSIGIIVLFLYDPYSYLANPPTMLTTLEAAEIFSGDEPISAIRIKVDGVSDYRKRVK